MEQEDTESSESEVSKSAFQGLPAMIHIHSSYNYLFGHCNDIHSINGHPTCTGLSFFLTPGARGRLDACYFQELRRIRELSHDSLSRQVCTLSSTAQRIQPRGWTIVITLHCMDYLRTAALADTFVHVAGRPDKSLCSSARRKWMKACHSRQNLDFLRCDPAHGHAHTASF